MRDHPRPLRCLHDRHALSGGERRQRRRLAVVAHFRARRDRERYGLVGGLLRPLANRQLLTVHRLHEAAVDGHIDEPALRGHDHIGVHGHLLARRLTRPIGELSAATRRLAAGEQDVAVPVRGEDELAELGASFNEMSGELSRAREAQGRFLESVSHELRTPLTSISGYSEALEEQAVTPTEAARVIGSEADRLERLVADLLDLARFGRSDFSVAREPVDLAGVVEQSVQRHLRRARDIGVELSGAGAAETWVLGDHDRILQAVSNLIENALRITPAGGSVTVDAGPGQISVRDTGPGLDPEDIPRAFERFYLHGRYRSERPVGSGLGLAIVQELICAMGGTVEVSTPPGGGAEFKIRLPSIPARSALPDAVRPSA